MGNELVFNDSKTDWHLDTHIHVRLFIISLIHSNFVPISLLVTLEVVKFFQAQFISNDTTMFDENQLIFAGA